MAKYENSKDKNTCKIVVHEIEEFKKLIKGYEKLLFEIGKL
jgi:predicted metal-binding protein